MSFENCNGCKFVASLSHVKGFKRCDGCSRRYADRYEPIPELTETEKAKARAKLAMLTAATAALERTGGYDA